MKIKLNKPFTANSAVDEFDVRQVKKALNRLGYYMPYEKTGITGIPDREVFAALKKFQGDHGLPATGTAKPGDATVQKLGSEAGQKNDGQYIWRTVGDNKVRKSHAELEGEVRDFADKPDPGEEPGCRCWAEPVTQAQGLKQVVTSEINDAEDKWTAFHFGWHFRFGHGKPVTLPEIGYLRDVVNKAREIMFHKIETQVADEMRKIQSGQLVYTTSNSYPRLSEVHWVLGKGTIETKTEGQVKKDGDILYIKATVQYSYFDEITDPIDIRQHKLGTSSTFHPEFENYRWTEFGGTPYPVTGKWETELTGSISLSQE